MLLGRTANGLFWMHRYIERAENMARIVDAGLRMALTRTSNASEEWSSVVLSAGAMHGYQAKYDQYSAGNVADFLLRDPDNPSSVIASIEAARFSGSGVCQDHAHIFLSAARLLGVPARYVSGYLLIEGRTEQTATHAWAEAYVDDLGWVGFDIANGVAPDEKYVRIACGLDYGQAAPITGLRSGSSAESLAVALNVEQ